MKAKQILSDKKYEKLVRDINSILDENAELIKTYYHRTKQINASLVTGRPLERTCSYAEAIDAVTYPYPYFVKYFEFDIQDISLLQSICDDIESLEEEICYDIKQVQILCEKCVRSAVNKNAELQVLQLDSIYTELGLDKLMSISYYSQTYCLIGITPDTSVVKKLVLTSSTLEEFVQYLKRKKGVN